MSAPMDSPAKIFNGDDYSYGGFDSEVCSMSWERWKRHTINWDPRTQWFNWHTMRRWRQGRDK